MDDTSVTDLMESTSEQSVGWIWLTRGHQADGIRQWIYLPSELAKKPHPWILLRTFMNPILCRLKNRNNRVCSLDSSDIFEPLAPCGQQDFLRVSRFVMRLFLSVALPEFPTNWFWLWRHVSTQAEENPDFCSAFLGHYIHHVPVQLHFPGPLALLLQVRFPPVGQLFLQRALRL